MVKNPHDNSKLVVGSGFATFDFEYSLLAFQKVLENHTGYSYWEKCVISSIKSKLDNWVGIL